MNVNGKPFIGVIGPYDFYLVNGQVRRSWGGCKIISFALDFIRTNQNGGRGGARKSLVGGLSAERKKYKTTFTLDDPSSQALREAASKLEPPLTQDQVSSLITEVGETFHAMY